MVGLDSGVDYSVAPSAGCNRIRTPRAFMVSAGTEHERFVDLFPSWEVSKTVQELNCKVCTCT